MRELWQEAVMANGSEDRIISDEERETYVSRLAWLLRLEHADLGVDKNGIIPASVTYVAHSWEPKHIAHALIAHSRRRQPNRLIPYFEIPLSCLPFAYSIHTAAHSAAVAAAKYGGIKPHLACTWRLGFAHINGGASSPHSALRASACSLTARPR